MNKKHFLISPSISPLSKIDIRDIHINTTKKINDNWLKKESIRNQVIAKTPELKCTNGRVIIKVDTEFKNQVSFNGSVIRLERQYNELNRRITQPVNAIVIDSLNIPKGAEVLVHHNCTHDTNRIFGAEKLIEGTTSTDVKYFSVKENECFLWRMGEDEWQPCTIFDTALRVFEPYTGMLEGIPHKKIKDVLYVTSGKLKGNCIATIKATDYEIIFNDINGKEHSIIRFRPYGDKENQRDEEAICLLPELTQRIQKKELYLGISEKDCKPI